MDSYPRKFAANLKEFINQDVMKVKIIFDAGCNEEFSVRDGFFVCQYNLDSFLFVNILFSGKEALKDFLAMSFNKDYIFIDSVYQRHDVVRLISFNAVKRNLLCIDNDARFITDIRNVLKATPEGEMSIKFSPFDTISSHYDISTHFTPKVGKCSALMVAKLTSNIDDVRQFLARVLGDTYNIDYNIAIKDYITVFGYGYSVKEIVFRFKTKV